MPLEIREIPKLCLWLFLMGLTTYITIKIAGKVREQVTATLK